MYVCLCVNQNKEKIWFSFCIFFSHHRVCVTNELMWMCLSLAVLFFSFSVLFTISFIISFVVLITKRTNDILNSTYSIIVCTKKKSSWRSKKQIFVVFEFECDMKNEWRRWWSFVKLLRLVFFFFFRF
jgi:hypothetical protein